MTNKEYSELMAIDKMNRAIKKLDTFVEYNNNNWKPVPVSDIQHDKKIMLDYIKKGLYIVWIKAEHKKDIHYSISEFGFKTRTITYEVNDDGLLDKTTIEKNKHFDKKQLDLIPSYAVFKDIV